MIEKTTTNRNYPKPDINNSLQDDVAHIENAMDMIDTDIHGMKQEMPLLTGSNPFLYCKMRRAGRGGAVGGITYTTGMEPLYNNTAAAPEMLKNFIGAHDSNVDTYSIPPMLQFVGPSARWIRSDGWVEYDAGDSQSNYRTYEMILMFIKNTGESNTTSTFSRYFSSATANNNYNKSSAYVGTPDQPDTDSSAISSIVWTTVHTFSDASYGTTASFDVTIPGGKTIALLIYSTPRNIPDLTNFYIFTSTIGIYDFGAFLTEGLVVDHKRTLKALQLRTQDIHEIWR